jgi:hypothetical protein
LFVDFYLEFTEGGARFLYLIPPPCIFLSVFIILKSIVVVFFIEISRCCIIVGMIGCIIEFYDFLVLLDSEIPLPF